jgi:D-alanyl-D-alanine-carboxypeptidase/D-alanyl-D-alanine-endopeptidase
MTMPDTTSPDLTHRARPSWQSIQRILGERVDAKRSAGIVVGVTDSGGRRVAAYGDPGPGQPPLDASSVFEIGSITKVFTAALLADMAARAEVALDEPVARLLPPAVRVPARGNRQIELVDLATHTSGLPRLPANLRWQDPAHPVMAGYTAGQLYEFLSGYTLTREIGSLYEYSNLGFGLLGHALALRAGMTYERLLSERILKPLGITMTGITLTPAMKQRLALPHGERGDLVPVWGYGGWWPPGGSAPRSPTCSRSPRRTSTPPTGLCTARWRKPTRRFATPSGGNGSASDGTPDGSSTGTACGTAGRPAAPAASSDWM